MNERKGTRELEHKWSRPHVLDAAHMNRYLISHRMSIQKRVNSRKGIHTRTRTLVAGGSIRFTS